MRIGIIVDGEAEYRALPHLLRRLVTPHTVLDPLVADVQPFAPIPKIVGAVRRKLPIVASKDVDMLLLLLDRETRSECPGELATTIRVALENSCGGQHGIGYGVVVKNRQFENWLVADDGTLRVMSARFEIAPAIVARITPNKADNVDALRILKDASRRDAYSKVADAVRILRQASPEQMALNSRSFRRMLRLVEHPAYVDQSKVPVAIR
jgi:hypothetical protein